MEMIATGTKCKLSVTPAGTTLWDHHKKADVEITALEHTSVDGKNQAFDIGKTGRIYANGGNGFLIEPLAA